MAAGRGQRGNIMVIGLTFGVLLGFSALAVDMGLVRLDDTEHQAAVDSAADSAVGRLDLTAAGVTAALQVGKTAAAKHRDVNGTAFALQDSDFEFGSWRNNVWLSYTGGAITDASKVNAVRINDTRAAGVRSVIGAAAFGTGSYDVANRAMAVRPAGAKLASANCYLPIAVPMCLLNGTTAGQNPPPLQVANQNTANDNIGWGLIQNNANTNDVRAMISGHCSSGTTPLTVGQPMATQQGAAGAVWNAIDDILNGNIPGATRWPTSLIGPQPLRIGPYADGLPPNSDVQGTLLVPGNWGNVIQGPLALVAPNQTGPVTAACPPGTDLDFGGGVTWYVRGVTWGYVYDVKEQGVNSSLRNMWIQVDFKNQHEIAGTVSDDPNTYGNTTTIGEVSNVNY